MNEAKWEIIKADGINPENKLFDFLFFPKTDYGVMLGSSYSDEDFLKKQFDNFSAICYSSNDGGKIWGGLGRSQFSSYAVNDSLVFISKVGSKNTANIDSTSIYF